MGKRIPLILSALAVLIVAGAAITGAAARPDGSIHPTNAASAKKVYKIALSNSFIGNKSGYARSRRESARPPR